MGLWFYRKGFRNGVMKCCGYELRPEHNGSKVDFVEGGEAEVLEKYGRFFFPTEEEMRDAISLADPSLDPPTPSG